MSIGSELKEQLEEVSCHLESQLTDSAKKAMADLQTFLDKDGFVDRCLKLGETFPGFVLPSAKGEAISLSELVTHGPVVISFFRGGWCPYCEVELKCLKKIYPKLQSMGVEVVAVSPQMPEDTTEMAKKHGLDFIVISDVSNRLAKKCGVMIELSPELREAYGDFGVDLELVNGDDTWSLPMPATFVLDQDMKVIFRDVSVDISQRACPDAFYASLEKAKRS